MLFPSLAQVQALSAQYNTIPVFFEFPADHQTPISIYSALASGEENAFLLESVNNGNQWDRYSFIGYHPALEVKVQGEKIQLGSEGNYNTRTAQEPYTTIQELLDTYKSPKMEGCPYFTGGLIGYFAYDTVRFSERRLVNVPQDDIGMPDCHLFMYDKLVAYDHLSSNAIVIVNLHAGANLEEQYQAAEIYAAEIAARIDSYHCCGQKKDEEPPITVKSNVSRDEYMEMVETAKRYIKAGDIFQVVLSQRFEIDNPPDSFEVYRRLRATNPPLIFITSRQRTMRLQVLHRSCW
jgi:anthranilate synthase component 1